MVLHFEDLIFLTLFRNIFNDYFFFAAEEALCSNLTDDTVLEVARFASLHNGFAAKNFAINCIVSNFSTIIKRDEWRAFVKDNLDLIHEIHTRLALKLSSQIFLQSDDDDRFLNPDSYGVRLSSTAQANCESIRRSAIFQPRT